MYCVGNFLIAYDFYVNTYNVQTVIYIKNGRHLKTNFCFKSHLPNHLPKVSVFLATEK